MVKSDSTKELAAALAKAQGAFPQIPKSRTVEVTAKSGAHYSFSYAPLEVIMGAIRLALADNGLCILQSADGERLVTTIMHSSGEFVNSGGTPIKMVADGPQAYGSALTYARRYDLTLTLGLVTEDDDDGNAAEGNSVKPMRETRRPSAETTRPARAQQPASDGPPPEGSAAKPTVTTSQGPGRQPEKGPIPGAAQPPPQGAPRKRPVPSGDSEIDAIKMADLGAAIKNATDEQTLKVAFLDAYQFAADIDDARIGKQWQLDATDLKNAKKKALGLA